MIRPIPFAPPQIRNFPLPRDRNNITSLRELYGTTLFVPRIDMEQPTDKKLEPALECAVEFLEVLPLIMGSLQCELRHDPATTLTMVQFRTLAFLSKHGTASVSQIADFLGLGLPATSKIIDGLVTSSAATRRGDPADRRRVLLEISSTGRNELLATRAITHNHLAELLSPLSETDRARLLDALRSLRPIFIKFSPGVCTASLPHEKV